MTERDSLQSVLGKYDCFRSDDGLQDQLDHIISSGMVEKGLDLKKSDERDWTKLGSILADYLQGRLDAEGYLTIGQCDKIASLAKCSKKLIAHIANVDAAKAIWFLDFEREAEDLDPTALKGFTQVLDAYSKMQPRSPRETTKKGDKKTGNDAGYLVATDELRSRLQLDLDRWWKANTGLPKDVDEDTHTPYREFLSTLFSSISLRKPPGSSSTAVQAARKFAVDRDKRFKDLSVMLAQIKDANELGGRSYKRKLFKDR